VSAPPAQGPRPRLSRLRDIGWSLWDPIGLLPDGESWEGKPYADEYDQYLLQAAGQLRHGASAESVAAYLISVEADRMGMEPAAGNSERALAVALAIGGDRRVWSDGKTTAP
jgi:hypothetical protein